MGRRWRPVVIALSVAILVGVLTPLTFNLNLALNMVRWLVRDDRFYLPGHGGPVTSPPAFLRGLKAHRRMRERAILERIRSGKATTSSTAT